MRFAGFFPLSEFERVGCFGTEDLTGLGLSGHEIWNLCGFRLYSLRPIGVICPFDDRLLLELPYSMTTLRSFSLCLLASLICASSAFADIVILNDGQRMEGDILSETPTSIRMKYRITPKIWDEKTVERSDIKEIIKQTPQEIEIVDLRKILPTPDLMPAEKYEQIVQDRLRPFVNKYAGTPEAEEIQEMIQTLLDEKRKVVSGEVKIEGGWVSAEDANVDRNNIEAFKIRTSMEKHAEAGDYLEALREFEQLNDYGELYIASPQYPKAVPLALEVLDKYEAIIGRMTNEQPIISKQRRDSLAKLIEPDLTRTKNAIDTEEDSWKAQVDGEKRARITWLTPYKYDIRSLQEVRKHIAYLRTELEIHNLEAIEQQNLELTAALRAIEAENVAAAESSFAKAKDMQGNGSRNFSRVMNNILQGINRLKSELMRRQYAKSTGFTPGGGALTGAPAATTDDRVAQAMQQAELANQAPGQPAGAPGTGSVPPGAMPPGAAPMPNGGVPPAPGAYPQQGGTYPPGAVPPQPGQMPMGGVPPVAAATEENNSFQTILMIGAGILVLILLIAIMSQKKKKE